MWRLCFICLYLEKKNDSIVFVCRYLSQHISGYRVYSFAVNLALYFSKLPLAFNFFFGDGPLLNLQVWKRKRANFGTGPLLKFLIGDGTVSVAHEVIDSHYGDLVARKIFTGKWQARNGDR